MESFRPHRSIGSDRFLAPFSPPDSGDSFGVELNEDDLFSTGLDSPDPDHPPPLRPSPPNPNSIKTRTSLSLSRTTRDGFHERNFGVLAALPEEESKTHLLQRKPSISISSSPSTSPSPSSSSARLIPAIPSPKPDFSLFAGGKMYHQSAPVNVPVPPPRLRKVGGDDEEEDEEEEMLPPHEIVARASGRGSPLTTFSVLEGAGRTLKGRDLRRANAQFRKFRYNGIDPDLEEQLDYLFRPIVATGEHAWAPSMDQSHFSRASINKSLGADLGSAEVGGSEPTHHAKKQKKATSAKSILKESMKQIVRSVQENLGGTSRGEPTTWNRCIDFLTNEPGVREDEKFYYFALRFLDKNSRRDMFLSLPPEDRIGFLRDAFSRE